MLLTSDLDPWLQVFGRFHIVLLHLPIGLLPGIALLEFGAAMMRKPNPHGSVLTLAVMTALAAGAAVASGLVLADEKTDSELLGMHKNVAIAMAIVCALLPIFAAFQKRTGFRIILMVAMGLSVWAGHLGGSMTHKQDFLFKPLERAARAKSQDAAQAKDATGAQDTAITPAVANPAKADRASSNAPSNTLSNGEGSGTAEPTTEPVAPAVPANPEPVPTTPESHFQLLIAPIFKRACTECHNPDDYKGDLDLTTKNGILCLDREEADRVLVPGKPDQSLLIELCELPLDDEDRMPPIDEDVPGPPEQLSKVELAALRAWILNGCKFD